MAKKKLYALDLASYDEAEEENQKTLDIIANMVTSILNCHSNLRIWQLVDTDYKSIYDCVNNSWQYCHEISRFVRGVEINASSNTFDKSYYYTALYNISLMFYDIVEKKSMFTINFDFDFITTDIPIELYNRHILVQISSMDNTISDKFNYDDSILSANFVDDLVNYIDVRFYNKIKKDTDNAKENANRYKKVVYLAHPYRGASDTTLEKIKNVRETDNILHKLTVECPNLTVISPVHTFMCLEGLVDGDEILERCFNLLSLCDEIWVFGDYKNSKGCLAEIEFAKQHRIKVIIMDIDRFFGL